MGDWKFEANNPSGKMQIVSPGYNSKYCVCIKAYGEKTYAKLTNVAYNSDAIMTVFYGKMTATIGGGSCHFKVGHTGYGNLFLQKNYTDWTKFRAVFYYNYNLGYAVGVLEEYDEDTGEWKSVLSSAFTGVTEPRGGNLYFRVEGYTTYSGWNPIAHESTAWLDNIELYTSKSLYVTKIVSEAVENVISKQ